MTPTLRAQITSTVLFARNTEATTGFYERVFGCSKEIEGPSAALLLSPAGFQIYVVERGPRSRYLTENLGPHTLMWSVSNAEDLDLFVTALRTEDAYVGEHENDGVRYIKGSDPDGAPVFCAFPGPDTRPRTLISKYLFQLITLSMTSLHVADTNQASLRGDQGD